MWPANHTVLLVALWDTYGEFIDVNEGTGNYHGVVLFNTTHTDESSNLNVL